MQAQYFLDNGLCPVKIGKGSRGDVFLQFVRDEKADKVFDDWCKRRERVM